MMHDCPNCEHEAEPVVVESGPDPAAVEIAGEASVEVARIEADRDVVIAKLQTRSVDEEVAVQLAALAAENDALRAQLAPAEPEQAQVVAVEAPAAAEPEGELPERETPNVPEHEPQHRGYGSKGWFGG